VGGGRDARVGTGDGIRRREVPAAEPLEGPLDQTEVLREVAGLLALFPGAAALANACLILAAG
jgi:hypothetical protein